MIRRTFLALTLISSSLFSFYGETVYGPEQAFELTVDDTRWEKATEVDNNTAGSFVYQHKEEPLVGTLIFSVLPRKFLAQATENDLLDAFTGIMEKQFEEDVFVQTNRVEKRVIGDKEAVFTELYLDIAKEESNSVCIVSALLFSGENYFIFHYVMCGDESTQLVSMEDIEEFLGGLKINATEM
jgi:hypothetical protein